MLFCLRLVTLIILSGLFSHCENYSCCSIVENVKWRTGKFENTLLICRWRCISKTTPLFLQQFEILPLRVTRVRVTCKTLQFKFVKFVAALKYSILWYIFLKLCTSLLCELCRKNCSLFSQSILHKRATAISLFPLLIV